MSFIRRFYCSFIPADFQIYCRNERFQEELWGKSFEFLKDHLSPETKEKYLAVPEHVVSGDTAQS